jgi:hypothetical protein
MVAATVVGFWAANCLIDRIGIDAKAVFGWPQPQLRSVVLVAGGWLSW